MAEPYNCLGLRFGHRDATDDVDDEDCVVEIEVWNKKLGAYVLVPEELAQPRVAVARVEVEDAGDAALGSQATDSPSSYGSLVDQPLSNSPTPFAFPQTPIARPLSPFYGSPAPHTSNNVSPTGVTARFTPQLPIIAEEDGSQHSRSQSPCSTVSGFTYVSPHASWKSNEGDDAGSVAGEAEVLDIMSDLGYNKTFLDGLRKTSRKFTKRLVEIAQQLVHCVGRYSRTR